MQPEAWFRYDKNRFLIYFCNVLIFVKLSYDCHDLKADAENLEIIELT